MLFFNDTATTEIYTLSLHDALPIYHESCRSEREGAGGGTGQQEGHRHLGADQLTRPDAEDPSAADRPDGFPCPCRRDRKSTRLNSSHANISYAVFCLKKKNMPISTI